MCTISGLTSVPKGIPTHFAICIFKRHFNSNGEYRVVDCHYSCKILLKLILALQLRIFLLVFLNRLLYGA